MIRILALVLTVAAIFQNGALAQANDYPNRTIKLVVGFPPGGIADITARILAQQMSSDWGQPVVVENRAGGSANPGTKSVATATPDGYTLLLGNVATHAINIHLYGTQHYDPVNDFQPIARVAQTSLILIANPSAPYNTIDELVRYAKANPKKLNFGSAGPGSISHMALELLNTMGEIQITHVPYRGTTAVVPDLLSGQIDGYFDAPGSALANVVAGNLKAVGVGGRSRISTIPQVKTIDETLNGYEISTWFGLFGPAGLPKAIVDKLNNEVRAILARPDIRERLAQQYLEATPSSPNELASFVQAEIAKYGKITKSVGMSAAN